MKVTINGQVVEGTVSEIAQLVGAIKGKATKTKKTRVKASGEKVKAIRLSGTQRLNIDLKKYKNKIKATKKEFHVKADGSKIEVMDVYTTNGQVFRVSKSRYWLLKDGFHSPLKSE